MDFTSERNHQIIIDLLKKHGIKKIVTSPGGTNVTFVASVQEDDYFELYSSVDERSAAYIACGMAEESGEPVVLSCTGATAARNYFSGLTEAYYRKLPILVITSTMPVERVGHLFPQCTDRSVISNDIAKHSVLVPVIKDAEDEWSCMVKCNEAILELRHNWCGPVHVNLETTGEDFACKSISPVTMMNRFTLKDSFPDIDGQKIGVFVGAHSVWSKYLTESIDRFCETYNAVVIMDHTSNYKGEYGVLGSLATSQMLYKSECSNFDLLIHIGNISGSYINLNPQKVWRVNSDGKIMDYFKKVEAIFEVEEVEFFEYYNNKKTEISEMTNYNAWKKEYDTMIGKITELPFSNIWIAKQLSVNLPVNSVLHLGILNSLRSWNFFEVDKSINCYCNTGGFGIDGCISSMFGAALASPNKLFYGVVGDLAFFYDMNVLGNRYYPNNMRLVVINNGKGQEFKNRSSRAASFCDRNDKFIAASGHYGNQSNTLIKNYAESLGIQYLTADSKDSFEEQTSIFLSTITNDSRPMVFEIFTDTLCETEALNIVQNLEKSTQEGAKQMAKKILGEKGVKMLKSFLKG